MEVLLLAHVPPAKVLVKVVALPTHIEAEPVVAGSSDIAVLPLFHLSSVPAPPVPSTAFMTPRKVTPPKPADGAVHGMSLTYCVPAPPDPTSVVASWAPLC